MFNAVKRLFGKRVEETVQEIPAEEVSPADGMVGYSEIPAEVPAHPAPRATRIDLRQHAAPAPAAVPAGASVGIPLKSILARLPADLMQRVRQLDVGEAEVFLPSAKLLTQLSQGSAKLSFGELRQLAPPGTFTSENDRDRVLVDLPLQEILVRLGPAALNRRQSQRQVEVPADVTGPFGGQSKVTISTSVAKNAAVTETSAPIPAPAAPVAPVRHVAPAPAPAPAAPAAPRFQPAIAMTRPGQPTGAVQPVVARVRANLATQPQPAPAPVAPAPVAPVQPVARAVVPPPAEEFVFKRNVAPAPAPAAAPKPVYSPISPDPVPAPVAAPEPIAVNESYRIAGPAEPITPIAPEPAPEPAPIRFNPPAPAPEPAAAIPGFAGETRFLSVSIGEVCESWPEQIRVEIMNQNVQNSLVGLPFGAVEGNIKSGRIAFPWKAVRSWIKPPLPATASQLDTTMLEFPLKVITPLFLAELKSSRKQKKIAVDDNIPNLFSDARMSEVIAVAQQFTNGLAAPTVPANPIKAFVPPPQAPVAPVMAPTPKTPITTAARTPDTNYFAWKGPQEAPVEEAPVFMKQGATPGTAFLKRYATPNDIVNKAAELEGVDGAIIALPDGLLVASRIPATMNPETIAAFLPQIFGRVSQCTRELRLGDLNNLNFTVGTIPWKIFRVGAIFFAAFGRPGEPLPSAQLASIAAELDRKAT